MCARYTLTAAPPRVEAFLEATGGALLRPRFNVAPGQEASIAVAAPGGGRALVARTFGLAVGGRSERATSARRPNARAETAAELRAFAESFRRRRGLVPADGFYEWRRGRHGSEPHHVALPGRSLFALAALFDPPGPDGAGGGFAILTGPAPGSLRALHPRAPILLERAHFDAWLDPALEDPIRLRALLANELAGSLTFRPVDPRVNDPRFDDPACLDAAPQLSLL